MTILDDVQNRARRQRAGRRHAEDVAKPVRPAILVELAGHYARDEAFERRRASFYADCAREFGFKSWSRAKKPSKPVYAGRSDEKPPLEFLYDNSVLSDNITRASSDDERLTAVDAGRRRYEAGIKLRDDFQASQISAMGSPDWMSPPPESYGSRDVPNRAIRAWASVRRVVVVTPARYFKILDKLLRIEHPIYADEIRRQRVARFVRQQAQMRHDEAVKAKDKRLQKRAKALMDQAAAAEIEARKVRLPIYEDIRLAFDYAAVGYGLLDVERFGRRWPAATLLVHQLQVSAYHARRSQPRARKQ